MELWSEIILPDGQRKDPIVFLHGTGSNSAMWKHQVEFFSKRGHPCLSIDLRGHGSSREPYEITDLQTHLSDIEQTLQMQQIPFPSYFIGHSLGSILSLFLASKQPQMVKGVFAASLPAKIIP